MKAILVDDERLALSHLKHTLEKYVSDIACIGEFSDPTVVIEQINELQPDVVFLDIQMPGINGLQLGEQVQAVFPDIYIVFVTAFDRFAMQAFELYALDYILKPVLPERLQQTVQRLREKMEMDQTKDRSTKEPMICAFQQIRFQLPAREPSMVRWGTNKALELFACLLHHRNTVVDMERLIELLWPRYEPIRAAQQLYTTIYHIRQTLKDNGMGTVTIKSCDYGTGYKLTLGEARVDTQEWERSVELLGELDSQQIAAYEHAFQAYTGAYLGAYGYLWAEQERERLCKQWLNLAKQLMNFYSKKDMYQKAIEVNQRVQQLLPGEKESAMALMKLHDLLGNSYNFVNNVPNNAARTGN